MKYRAKDFIETAEGLVFAVVTHITEDNRVLCFLRYIREKKKWRKVSTEQANSFLSQSQPLYLHHSTKLDADLHAVPLSKISKHHQPQIRLAELLSYKPLDAVEKDLHSLCHLFSQYGLPLENMGVTGSLLIGTQNPDSDIDLVFYGRDIFQQARKIVSTLIMHGSCQTLTESAWLESYQRRDCDLSLQEYVWHEQRKFNKLMINHRKVDLNMIVDDEQMVGEAFIKLGEVCIRTKVLDDFYGFDYPARFKVDHTEIKSVICFTATYTGQAKKGELIEVAGQLEQFADGIKRIVVGSTREAPGEYIKVLHNPKNIVERYIAS